MNDIMKDMWKNGVTSPGPVKIDPTKHPIVSVAMLADQKNLQIHADLDLTDIELFQSLRSMKGLIDTWLERVKGDIERGENPSAIRNQEGSDSAQTNNQPHS